MHNQEADIVGALLTIFREVLGAGVLPPAKEREIESRLRDEWGGQKVYVTKVSKLSGSEVEARALSIRARYNMCNRRELQAEYGLSRTQFYKILKGG